MKKNNQKGSSLLITLLVMAALLSIAFGLSTLGLGEIKLSQDTSTSLISYYAAEAGVECQMFNDRLSSEVVCANTCLDAGQTICYQVQVSGSYINNNPPRTIKSSGSYQDVIRAIQLTY